MKRDSTINESFNREECAEKLHDVLMHHTMVVSPNGKYLVSEDQIDGQPTVEFFVPPCMPLTPTTQNVQDYLAGLADDLGEQLVILMQAGAAALGWWSDDELIHHKVLKTYAVRGKGRAQPAYAKTKGKSRYGSRLRLRNAQQQLVDINEKIHDWWAEEGGADRIFYSCPQRSWPELFAAKPAPPFDQRDERLIRIPMHVHAPRFEELLRVRRDLLRGRIRYRLEV